MNNFDSNSSPAPGEARPGEFSRNDGSPAEEFEEESIEDPAAPVADLDDSPLEAWKDAMRSAFEEWLESIEQVPALDEEERGVTDAPDLYSFYSELAAATAENRKSNRRTAEAFSQWGDTLLRFETDVRQLREHLARIPATGSPDDLPRGHCLALVEMLDRLIRITAAFGKTPARTWWGSDTEWRAAWENQRQAFAILQGHLEALAQTSGITRMKVEGELFDPSRMVATATEDDPRHPGQFVLEQLMPGYIFRGQVLRPAQVKVNLHKGTL